MDLREMARAVMIVYRDVEEATRRYREASGLSCPRGCGVCCLAPFVEASILELIPLALALHARGEGDAARERAHQAIGEPGCVLYRPEPVTTGHCTEYAYRALVCRLYGFCGRLDKRGRVEPIACPHVVRTPAPPGVGSLPPPPIVQHYRIRLHCICPSLGHLTSINEALRDALDYVALRLGPAWNGREDPGGWPRASARGYRRAA